MNEINVQSRKKTPPNPLNAGIGVELKKSRSSNLELYRIICMLMIVAHHYVVNSGLTSEGGILQRDLTSTNSIFMTLFGAWGKTGINCFLMITGYFMCTSKITLKKFIRLMGQIYLYRWIIFIIFYVTGYETLSPMRMLKLIMPVWNFSDGFTSCFIGFWLTIPFLNILVQNMNKRQHELLLLLLLGMFTFLGSIPTFHITFNYVVWFGFIYFIASYIRLYPRPLFERRNLWGWIALLCFVLGCVSILCLRLIVGASVSTSYFFISDSNKILAVAIAVCSFLWFKNMPIRYSKVINAFGAGTFGVLLIHANSSAMRTWLWSEKVDVIGHYTLPLESLILYSIVVVLAIFIICNLIDQLRIATVEKLLLRWYDRNVAVKADAWIQTITK
jgi:hypothetical protein